jgi:2-iminobutanoate/2-iminopropanoate deaminase
VKRNIVSTEKAPAAIGPYSQAICAGGFVFTSGQIALDPETMEIRGNNVREQAETVFANLKAVLEAAGSSLDDAVRLTVYMKDLSEFGVLNEVYASHFGGEPPARACVEVSRLPKDVLVEIDAVALVRT